MNYQQWLIAAVIFVILEILPPATHFFFLCLALGSLAASIAAYFGGPAWAPWVAFGVVSIGSLPLLIPLARFLFTPKPTASNADEVLNQEALVTEPISEHKAGLVKVRGEVWRATSEDGPHGEGEKVHVVRIDGTHVVVRRSL